MTDLTGFPLGVDLVETVALPMRELKDGEEFVHHWRKHPHIPSTYLVSAELLAQIKEFIDGQHTLSAGE